MRNHGKTLMVILGVLLLAACGGSGTDNPEPTNSANEQITHSVQQTVAAISVAQTVAAITGDQTTPASVPTADTTQPLPTPVVLASATTPVIDQTQLTSQPPTPPPPTAACTVVQDVNLRPGPGTVYEPAIVSMRVNTQLMPLAFSPTGFPQGPWLYAQLTGTGQVGWVSAGSQYILCNIDLNSLPLATNLPPTPQPAASPTPSATATKAGPLPPNVDNDAPGGSFPEDGTVKFNIIVDPNFLFRMDVRDLTVGDFEGAGIESVGFSISGNGVDYFREERTAGFCVFGGGEPTCRPWPTNELGQFTWGEGGPVVQSGEYFINMAVKANREDEAFGGFWNWNFNFRLTFP